MRHVPARRARMGRRGALQARDAVALVPVPDVEQHHHAQQRHAREPGDARLTARQHDEGREQRTGGGTEVAAHLKDRLRQPVAAAGGHARDPRGLRMKHRGAGADEARATQQQRVAAGKGEQQQARQRESHADRQAVGPRAAVGVGADERLQERGGELEGEGEQPDLTEAQLVGALEHRVHRRQERLHHVVQQVAEADGREHPDGGLAGGARGADCSGADSFNAMGSSTTMPIGPHLSAARTSLGLGGRDKKSAVHWPCTAPMCANSAVES